MEDRTIFMRTTLISKAFRTAAIGITVWVSIAAAQPASAATPNTAQVYQGGRELRGDKTITGSEFTLQSGERLRGSLTVLGGEVHVEEGSIVEGDLIILGGSADVAGRVTGDVNVLGGEVNLSAGSQIDGGVTAVGGDVNRNEGAQVGQVRSTRMRDNLGNDGFWHKGPWGNWANDWDNGSDGLGGVIAITLFAMAVAFFLPSYLGQGVAAVRSHTLHSLVVGGLSFGGIILAAVMMSITLILIPAAIVLSIATWLLALAGWVIVARIIGGRLMQGFGKTNWTLVGQVAAGSLVLAVLGMLPIVGDLIGWGAALTGFGALILTRLGTQVYPKPNTALTTMPPTSPMSV